MHEEIRQFIQRELLMDPSGTTIQNDTPLLDEAYIDSLGVFRLATFVEERYGVRVHDVEMVPEHFGTLDALVRFVEGKRTAR